MAGHGMDQTPSLSIPYTNSPLPKKHGKCIKNKDSFPGSLQSSDNHVTPF